MQTEELFVGMNIKESSSFIFDNILFIKDGLNYLEYDGESVSKVAGTIPMTSYYKNPDGSTSIDSDTDTDLVYQAVNCLTPLRRNAFIGDGESVNYQLDSIELDPTSEYLMEAEVNSTKMVENIDFSVDRKRNCNI